MDNMIITDASAIMAVVVYEPVHDYVIQITKDKIIAAPPMIAFEIANGLTKMMKKKVITSEDEMIEAFKYFKRISIKTVEVDMERALKIAWKYKIYSYDACYLELAERLDLPLLTFDGKMADVAKDMKLVILGGNDANS
jgi:predicted nucleic acid-binding protein